MKMPKNINIYQNKWVALDLKREKVIASGDSFKEVDQKAERLTKSQDKYIMSRVLDSHHTYSP